MERINLNQSYYINAGALFPIYLNNCINRFVIIEQRVYIYCSQISIFCFHFDVCLLLSADKDVSLPNPIETNKRNAHASPPRPKHSMEIFNQFHMRMHTLNVHSKDKRRINFKQTQRRSSEPRARIK